MISADIHNHLLPGVDDGFKLRENSLEAIKRMSSLGCKSFYFSPHLNPEIFPDSNEEKLKVIYKDFIDTIPAELGVTTHLAAEYMVVKDFEERAEESLLCYEDKHILIEMSYYYRSENLETAVFQLTMAGYIPILAHPERYLYMDEHLKDFTVLKDMGCEFQLNLLSLSGIYGRSSMHICDYLISNDMYDFVGSDLHTLPQLDSIVNINYRKYSAEVEKLSDNNNKLFI